MVKIQIGLMTTYRYELIWQWVFRLFQFFTYYSLWNLTSSTQGDSSKLLVYIGFTFLIVNPLQSGKLASRVSKDIVNGELSKYLIRPLNYPITVFISILSPIIVRIFLPVLIIFVAVIFNWESLGPESIQSLILSLGSVVISFLLWNAMMFCLGALAFWIGLLGQLVNVVDLILSTLKGVFIPLYFFPEWFQIVLAYTPISYLVDYPVQVYLGTLTDAQLWRGGLIMCLWLGILLLGNSWIYNAGVRKYEAAGA